MIGSHRPCTQLTQPHATSSHDPPQTQATAPWPPAAGAPNAQSSLPSTTSSPRPLWSRRASATDRLTPLQTPGAPHSSGDDSSSSPPAKYARWSDSNPSGPPLLDGRSTAVGAAASSQSLPGGACGSHPLGSKDGSDGLTSSRVQGDASAGEERMTQQQSLLALRQLAKVGLGSNAESVEFRWR